jgi:hypothetical protein
MPTWCIERTPSERSRGLPAVIGSIPMRMVLPSYLLQDCDDFTTSVRHCGPSRIIKRERAPAGVAPAAQPALIGSRGREERVNIIIGSQCGHARIRRCGHHLDTLGDHQYEPDQAEVLAHLDRHQGTDWTARRYRIPETLMRTRIPRIPPGPKRNARSPAASCSGARAGVDSYRRGYAPERGTRKARVSSPDRSSRPWKA